MRAMLGLMAILFAGAAGPLAAQTPDRQAQQEARRAEREARRAEREARREARMRDRADRLSDGLYDLPFDIRIPPIVIPRIRLDPLDFEVPRIRLPSFDIPIPEIRLPETGWERDLEHDLFTELDDFAREIRDFGWDMERFGWEWRDQPPRVRIRTGRHRPI